MSKVESASGSSGSGSNHNIVGDLNVINRQDFNKDDQIKKLTQAVDQLLFENQKLKQKLAHTKGLLAAVEDYNKTKNTIDFKSYAENVSPSCQSTKKPNQKRWA